MSNSLSPLDQRDPDTFSIIGAAMAVHKELGHGFLEAVYHEAFCWEMTAMKLPFAREVELPILYRGQTLSMRYRADFLCFGEIIVEIKALAKLTGTEESQVIHYLKASRQKRALLINFGSPRLEYRRFIL